MLPNPLYELVAPPSAEERFVAYAVREHRSGRRLSEILGDAYLRNRLTADQRARLLEQPELARAVRLDTAAAAARPARA
jgi:hypothetical protein